MSKIIVDCSIALAWSVENQSSPLTIDCERVVSAEGGLVPFIFPMEIGNALLVLERRGKLRVDQVDRALVELDLIELEIDNLLVENAHTALMPLARRHQLTLYDAAYLELSLRTDLPLATRDEALAKAAKKAGAILFQA